MVVRTSGSRDRRWLGWEADRVQDRHGDGWLRDQGNDSQATAAPARERVEVVDPSQERGPVDAGARLELGLVPKRYVADFLATSARLIVEVDGGYHARRRVADARRDRDLARFGYRVLRLPAALVMSQPSRALALIAAALAAA